MRLQAVELFRPLETQGEPFTAGISPGPERDAVVGIGTDLDLRSTLQRIVRAACALADAQYGALGIIGALVAF